MQQLETMTYVKINVPSLKDKVNIINALHEVKQKAEFCREFGLVNSTVRSNFNSIGKNREHFWKEVPSC